MVNILNTRETLGVGAIGALIAQFLTNKEVISVVGIAILCCVVVFIAISMDLISGVRKARSQGVFRSSFGFRRTINKIIKYYSAIFMGGIIDLMIIVLFWHLNTHSGYNLPLIPIFTIVVSGGCIWVEYKSILETVEDKDKAKAQEVISATKQITENGLDTKAVLTSFLELLEKNIKDKNE